MDTNNVPVCTHVSEGKEDEELLENLKALDPCGEFDDDAFPKRVQDFLEQYKERMSGSSAKPDQAEEALFNPLQSLEEGSKTNGKESLSPRLQPRYSGVERKSMVRFKDLPVDIESPINGRQPSRRSLLPTPAPSSELHGGAQPLTYRRDNYAHFFSEDCESINAIAKLLVATERLDLQDTWESRPKKGQVLVTSHGQHNTYSIVVKKRHFDEID